jgi:sugar phosphate isomerase/epimerase
MQHALIVAFFGRLRDRFCEYGPALAIEQKLQRAAEVEGVQGAELIYPDECGDAAKVSDALAASSLAPAAINVNLKGLPMFHKGALSSSDAAVRRQALDLILAAKDFTLRVGGERLTCAPLADGSDYFLQQDYAGAWKRAVELLRAAIDEGPSLALHLEHKPSDPRSRGMLRTSDSVLRLIADIGRPRAGITFNAGHASIDGSSPAASLSQALAMGAPVYVHFGDAAGSWDWDLLAGSYHFWGFHEFLATLEAAGYDGWMTDDSFPVRCDPRELFAANIRRIALLRAALRGEARFREEIRLGAGPKGEDTCCPPEK